MQTELPAVIGISGPKRSGKDTLAQFLVERHGYERHAFADPLKEMALRLDPIIGADYEGLIRLSDVVSAENGPAGWETAKDQFPEVRRTLQFLGTEVVRSIKPGHWTSLMADLLWEADNDGRKIVVPDIRFDNEAALIRDFDGVIVEVIRPALGAVTDEHVSEQRIEGDLVLLNDSTPESLYSRLLEAL